MGNYDKSKISVKPELNPDTNKFQFRILGIKRDMYPPLDIGECYVLYQELCKACGFKAIRDPELEN